MPSKHEVVLNHALRIPGNVLRLTIENDRLLTALQVTNKLAGKRVILASNSPRRQEILKTLGLAPEIVPSTFNEDLPYESFNTVYEYPVATATEKAVEVYERLVAENPDDPPDLVIGADTVVLSRHSITTSPNSLSSTRPDILEKPRDRADNLRMLLDLNGGTCEVVTGITVLVYPIITAPGYAIKSMEERTVVYFADNPIDILKAYADSGEGIDRAGGFAIQGVGGILVGKIEGDYSNVVGFPGAAFFMFLARLIEEEDDFLAI